MENEKRLIWDEDAKRHLIALAVGHHTETLHIDMILNAILYHTTTVDAVEVVHGRWEEDEVEAGDPYDGNSVYCFDVMRCSVCGECFDVSVAYNYCPNCGAKMDGERKDNERKAD